MSIIMTKGPANTAASAAIPAITPDSINYNEDYCVSSQKTDEVILSNLNAALDAPKTCVTRISAVNDIYSGTNVAAASRVTNRRGMHLFQKVTEVWTLKDSDDASYDAKLPIKLNVSVTVPVDSNVSEDDVIDFVSRNLGFLFDPADTEQCRLRKLLRGSLIPTEL